MENGPIEDVFPIETGDIPFGMMIVRGACFEAGDIPASYVTSWWLIFCCWMTNLPFLEILVTSKSKDPNSQNSHTETMFQEILRGKPTGLDGVFKPWYNR